MVLRPVPTTGLLVALAGAVLIVGCTAGPAGAPTTPNSSTAAEPSALASATAGPPSISPTSTPGRTSTPTSSPIPVLALTSPAFTDGTAIPRRFTCDGANVSPPLNWTGVPPGTVALALIVDDPDASGFVHWVAYNISPVGGSLGEGASSGAGAPPQGRNGFGTKGYGGPCPPSGTHHYVFRLLALDTPLSLGGTPRASDVLAATEGHVLGEARLTGTYRRG